MKKRCDQDLSISNCENDLCRTCFPDENFTNYDDLEGYAMTNHDYDEEAA